MLNLELTPGEVFVEKQEAGAGLGSGVADRFGGPLGGFGELVVHG